MVLASLAVAALFSACGMPTPDTPLTQAALRGSAEEVRALLGKGADPNARESHGLTPLVLAARLGHVEVAKALLEGGADPDLFDRLRTRPGWTPLMNAAHKGQPKIVRLLLEAGADANLKCSDGTTALTLAAVEDETEIVRMLLDAGADPHAGTRGSAALTGAVANCRIANVRALLEKAPDLRLEEGMRGHAAAMIAKLRGHGDLLRLIHEAVDRPGPSAPKKHASANPSPIEIGKQSAARPVAPAYAPDRRSA